MKTFNQNSKCKKQGPITLQIKTIAIWLVNLVSTHHLTMDNICVKLQPGQEIRWKERRTDGQNQLYTRNAQLKKQNKITPNLLSKYLKFYVVSRQLAFATTNALFGLIRVRTQIKFHQKTISLVIIIVRYNKDFALNEFSISGVYCSLSLFAACFSNFQFSLHS